MPLHRGDLYQLSDNDWFLYFYHDADISHIRFTAIIFKLSVDKSLLRAYNVITVIRVS